MAGLFLVFASQPQTVDRVDSRSPISHSTVLHILSAARQRRNKYDAGRYRCQVSVYVVSDEAGWSMVMGKKTSCDRTVSLLVSFVAPSRYLVVIQPASRRPPCTSKAQNTLSGLERAYSTSGDLRRPAAASGYLAAVCRMGCPLSSRHELKVKAVGETDLREERMVKFQRTGKAENGHSGSGDNLPLRCRVRVKKRGLRSTKTGNPSPLCSLVRKPSEGMGRLLAALSMLKDPDHSLEPRSSLHVSVFGICAAVGPIPHPAVR